MFGFKQQDNVREANNILDQELGRNGQVSYDAEFHTQLRQDIIDVLQDFKSLRLKVVPYSQYGSSPIQLFNLTGTFPIFYLSTKYNIPISIYIPDLYPMEAPIIFVVPTANMVVRPNHACVDPQGRVTSALDALHDWSYPTSNLRTTLGELQVIFGEEPPLYETPPGSAAAAAAAASGGNTGNTYGTHTGNTAAFSNPLTSGGAAAGGGSGNIWDAVLNVGGRPQHNANNRPQQPTGGGGGGQSNLPSWMQPPTNSGSTPVTNTPSVDNAAWQRQQEEQKQAKKAAIQQQLENAYKTSAVAALTARLQASAAAALAVKDAERQQQVNIAAELKQRQAEFKAELQALKKEREDVDQAAHELQTANAALQQWLTHVEPRVSGLSSSEQEGIIDPDVTIVPADELSRQALLAQAADLAYEDAIQALGVALESNNLTLETYLKQVRVISRRQFAARALSNKVALAQQHEEQQQQQQKHASAQGSQRRGLFGVGGGRNEPPPPPPPAAQLGIGDVHHATGGILTNPLAASRRF